MTAIESNDANTATVAVPPAKAASATTQIADPFPVAFGLFAFALAVYGIRFVSVGATTLSAGSTTVALNYAVLVAAVGEVIVGTLGLIRGDRYASYIVLIFGAWLLGFYMLITSGVANKEFTPDALAWYALVLIVPVVILAVPAFAHRDYPFIIAFIALTALLVTFGLGYHDLYNQIVSATKNKSAPSFSTAVNLLKISAWCAFAAAASIWYVFAREVYKLTGVIRAT